MKTIDESALKMRAGDMPLNVIIAARPQIVMLHIEHGKVTISGHRNTKSRRVALRAVRRQLELVLRLVNQKFGS